MCRGVRACPLGADGDIQWNVISRVLLPHRCAVRFCERCLSATPNTALARHYVALSSLGDVSHLESFPVFRRSAILLAKLWSDLCDQRGGMPELPGTHKVLLCRPRVGACIWGCLLTWDIQSGTFDCHAGMAVTAEFSSAAAQMRKEAEAAAAAAAAAASATAGSKPARRRQARRPAARQPDQPAATAAQLPAPHGLPGQAAALPQSLGNAQAEPGLASVQLQPGRGRGRGRGRGSRGTVVAAPSGQPTAPPAATRQASQQQEHSLTLLQLQQGRQRPAGAAAALAPSNAPSQLPGSPVAAMPPHSSSPKAPLAEQPGTSPITSPRHVANAPTCRL